MALNTAKLDEIFSRYGYEEKKINKDVKVYILRQGMYYGAEIIPLKNELNVEEVKNELTDYGYMCRIRKFQNENEAESKLFEGFFNVRMNLNRLKKKYESFTEKLVSSTGSTQEFRYINSPYRKNNEQIDQTKYSIVEDVYKILESKGSHFILIEAAAGFGKTCTAYEILNKLTTNVKSRCPLFTELSRNRQAKIFRYVLLSEIEEEFHGLVHSDLVIHHIKSGRIPVIIDGFDELLSKEHDQSETKNSEFEQVETMLSTIAELLDDNAKIVLTSRKTAVFSSTEFFKWIDKWKGHFQLTRFTIDEPKIQDWLSEEQLNILDENKVPIRYLANPVLLSYLRDQKSSNFKKLISSNENLVQRYFSNMLIREQDRQNLKIEPSLQYSIFKGLAMLFAELNISSEDRMFVKEMILDYNKDILAEVRNDYPSTYKPTIDELADTLVNHALLDRLSSKSKNIGFINDFIFGYLIGEAFLEREEYVKLEENMAELAVGSFQFQKTEKRNKLWTLLNQNTKWNGQFKINMDIKLKNFVYGNFKNEFFEQLKFDKITFDTSCTFEGCTFNECRFTDSIFNREVFRDCTFIGSKFYNCTVISNDKDNIKSEIIFINCLDSGNGFIETLGYVDALCDSDESNDNIEKTILDKFLRVDGKTSRTFQISVLLNEFPMSKQKTVLKLIHTFEQKGYLITDGNNAFMTQDGNFYYGRKFRS
ncbi:MAG: hypothetical protein JXR48_10355 [Candidatus Delongbacteria bacterium]|nr:hypothetical protein [Candidatus Delongbacteria bacterium]MBN2835357.1 hypothetical protein [Candidatus Delongbacteria bacterium]